MAAGIGALESLVDQLTLPRGSDEEYDWDVITKFCEKVREERDGYVYFYIFFPSLSSFVGATHCQPRRMNSGAGIIPVILDKCQRKNANVALRALTLLEAVVKACGPKVHEVVGKFRFLNELIKLVSPRVR
jgi:hypothetical protein